MDLIDQRAFDGDRTTVENKHSRPIVGLAVGGAVSVIMWALIVMLTVRLIF